MSTVDEIRGQAWDRSLTAFGTAYIFEQRAHRYQRWLRILTFLGIGVPLVVGSAALSFGKPALSPILVTIAGVLAVMQVVGSAWSLVAGWDNSFRYALESLNSNHRLAQAYKRLGETPPPELSDLQTEYALLDKEDELTQIRDYQQGITEEEKQMGMRAASRQCVFAGADHLSRSPRRKPRREKRTGGPGIRARDVQEVDVCRPAMQGPHGNVLVIER